MADVTASFSKSAKLIVGCKSGGRSARACQLLASMGYQHLWNVDGGFGGKVDPRGQTIKGWASLGLPVETGP